MSRQLIIVCATLFCGAMLHAQETPDTSPYRTIHTVIRVAGDVDTYLDSSDLDYPTFENDRTALIDDTNWNVDSPIQLSSNEVSGYELNAFADVGNPETLAAYQTEINMHVDELIAMPATTAAGSTPTTSDSPNTFDRTRFVSSPSDWQPTVEPVLADVQRDATDTARLRVPVIAANQRTASGAESAGLLVFLTLLIAPFAWLGWSEYNELVARTKRAVRTEADESQAESTIATPTVASEPCETKSRFQEEAEQKRQATTVAIEEEVEFTEITNEFETASAAVVATEPEAIEDDCEYELGVLEEANTMLASVGRFRSTSSDEDETERTAPTTDEPSTAFSGELTQLRGVGPATRDFLASRGICDLNDLLQADMQDIKEILSEGGTRFQAAQPEKWLEQARGMLTPTR